VAEGDARFCAAIPSCQGEDDGFEPNDFPADGSQLPQVSDSLYACPANADWYLFPVVAGDRVAAEIRFDGAAVDLDLFLFGPSSADPRAFSVEETGDVEFATFVARSDGTAGLLVLPYGIGEGSYEIQVDVQAGQAPVCASPGGFCQAAQDCCSGFCHFGHCH
jgi:hypothetical protein